MSRTTLAFFGHAGLLAAIVLLCSIVSPIEAASQGPIPPLQCLAFSPYVEPFDPATGPHPPSAVIERLLDNLIQQTSASCIMTYGVLNGLDLTFAAARERGLEVIAIIWLDGDQAVNEASIAAGIAAALAYPDVIIRLSCGSEIRTRHGTSLDTVVFDCINRVRSAGATQGVTSIDTWWEWCNRAWPCQTSGLGSAVDWIGVNIFPWWENKFSGLFPCTSAAEATDFHIERMQEVMDQYPNKAVVLTEFGWPSGPAGYRETNQFTGQECGLASESNQALVIQATLAKLRERGWSGVVFEAYQEPWKAVEGIIGPRWGLCLGTGSYRCMALELSGSARSSPSEKSGIDSP